MKFCSDFSPYFIKLKISVKWNRGPQEYVRFDRRVEFVKGWFATNGNMTPGKEGACDISMCEYVQLPTQAEV